MLRVTSLFETFLDHRKLFRHLLSGAAGPGLLEKLEAFMDAFFLERRLPAVGQEHLALPMPLATRVLTSTLCGLAAWWMDHPRAFTSREMASHYLGILERGLFVRPEVADTRRGV